MTHLRILGLTAFAMTAFAANSLLCRAALKATNIDPAGFTGIRLLAGAVTLYLAVRFRHFLRRDPGIARLGGNWISAAALFVYAAGFSFAYVTLPAATGALLLFGSVQATMIGSALWSGGRPGKRQLAGLLIALGGLAGLLFPGLSAPPVFGSLLMLCAGVAWGVYSLRGKGVSDPTAATAGNFVRAVPVALALSLVNFRSASFDGAGVGYAILSGALASGVGYAIWYAALRGLNGVTAASVQLSVPVLAAAGGIVLLGETASLRLLIASTAILGGIALVVTGKWKTG
jgi:drug/metabolite transporter (DMT)-like permease